jgi:hypothetical protein
LREETCLPCVPDRRRLCTDFPYAVHRVACRNTHHNSWCTWSWNRCGFNFANTRAYSSPMLIGPAAGAKLPNRHGNPARVCRLLLHCSDFAEIAQCLRTDLGLRLISALGRRDEDIGAWASASLFAVASPIPLEPPVTTATLPSGFDITRVPPSDIQQPTATLVMRPPAISIATGLDLIPQRSVGRRYFDKWLWPSVNWRKNWLRVAKQHARRTRIRKKMPNIGQFLPAD